MKKIVVIENNFSATVTMRYGLMRFLGEQGYDVYILSHNKETYADKLKEIRATFIEIGTSNTNPGDVLKYISNLHKAIKKIGPGLCLTFTPRQNIYGNIVCRKLGIPVISNITGTGVPFHIKGIIYGLGRLLYRIVLKMPVAVFFQNQEDFDHLTSRGYVQKQKAVLIPGSGIDTTYFTPVKRPQRGEGAEKFRFLFVGRLVKVKGITELMAAAKNIIVENKDCEFWIVGPLWKQNTGKLTVTEEEVNSWQQPGIIFKGESHDVRKELAECDCFVLPSYREGMSNALLEAASMERPIVSTDVPGCRDIVKDGINGFLCKPQDSLSLEDALLKMMKLNGKERTEMGIAGRRFVKDNFEKSIVVGKYSEQIKRVLNG